MKAIHSLIEACERILEGTGQLPQSITVDIAVMDRIKDEMRVSKFVELKYDDGVPHLFLIYGKVEILEGKPKG